MTSDMPTRAQAVQTLEQGQAALDALFAQLSPDAMARPATIAGGDWSAKDLLAHIAFWEELADQTLQEWRARRRPAVQDMSGPAATDAANARNYELSVNQSLAEVRQRASASHQRILQEIHAMSDDEWNSAPAYSNTTTNTLGELLGGVLAAPSGPFRHAFAHLADLEAYVQSVAR